MRKIIAGKRYDTETATKIGWANDAGSHQGDFRYWEAALYRTNSGNFFLAGRGGAMSMFASPCRGGMGGGSGIIPLDRDAALEFCEDHLDTEVVEQFFAADIQDA